MLVDSYACNNYGARARMHVACTAGVLVYPQRNWHAGSERGTKPG